MTLPCVKCPLPAATIPATGMLSKFCQEHYKAELYRLSQVKAKWRAANPKRDRPPSRECERCIVGTPIGKAMFCLSCNASIDKVILRARDSGTSNREIAAMVGLSESAMAQRLSRALRARGLKAAPVGTGRSLWQAHP